MRILHHVDENNLSWSKPWLDLLKKIREMDGLVEHFIACRPGGALAGRARDEGFEVLGYRPMFAWSPALCREFGSLLEEIRPDVIHTRLSSAAFIGSYWGKKKKIPVVATVDKFPKGRYYANSTLLIAPSTAVAKHMENQGFSTSKIRIIANPVAVKKYEPNSKEREKLRNQEGVKPSELVILGMGRFVPWKGFDLLIRAVGALGADRPISLWLVGDGPMREELIKLAEEVFRGLSNRRVKFFPFAKDVRPFLWASDLFVQPSYHVPGSGGPEAFGIALLEAMASGLPVVAFACGGTLDLVRDGHNGWLAEAGDSDSLKKALQKALCVIPDKTKSLMAIEEAKKHDVFAIAEQHLRLYKELI
ncbi:glycosyltransferase [Thermovirga sp.]|uniref:glycosyltransferase n=1 Tax=Thermovirga sp. TaxID=2699834 RepID=UPI0025D07C11|nr:glycosyltransferase [Thermovirga sp.]MBO8154590.1 glycosyltransferase [Thermovirga sp.]